MSRRRSRNPGFTTIYWRDIPAQITATTDNGHNEKIMLHPRFQHAIDRAAHVAGLTETHKYIEQWRRVTTPVQADAVAAAQSAADSIHSQYHKNRLEALVANGGLAPDNQPEPRNQPEPNEKEPQHHD
ncbi:MAG: virulence factor [Acidimicrobiaceae bacterium]|nr:virulence factor [Acidimicrobiaceae bacterium]MDE0607469.1 virulence factor [Acidimicrobiaceae bacterium]